MARMDDQYPANPSMMSPPRTKSLNIVVVPFNAIGHVNGCQGLARRLSTAGHKIYFLLEKSFQGQTERYGFQEVIYHVSKEEEEEEETQTNHGGTIARCVNESDLFCQLNPLERLSRISRSFSQNPNICKAFIQIDQCLKRLMKEIHVDLFVMDEAYTHPAIFYSGRPWIRCWTSAPFHIIIDQTKYPPPLTGLPTANGIRIDIDETEKCYEILKKLFHNSYFNDLLEKMGYKRYPNDDTITEWASSLTIYGYPKELNLEHIENNPRWFNLEVFDFLIQEKPDLKNLIDLVGESFYADTLDGKWTGKWIYLSLGSMGSIDLNLMRRLTGILAKTNHKYLVSKGPRHEEFQLPGNQWGSRFLPQISILPFMDLVITHGGNNTVTESFVRAKPMIVMPLFFDQLDNAQRIQETGYGARIDPFDFNDQELIDTIERLINDQKLKKKIQSASERIRNSSQEKLDALLERIQKIVGN